MQFGTNRSAGRVCGEGGQARRAAQGEGPSSFTSCHAHRLQRCGDPEGAPAAAGGCSTAQASTAHSFTPFFVSGRPITHVTRSCSTLFIHATALISLPQVGDPFTDVEQGPQVDEDQLKKVGCFFVIFCE